MTEVETLDLSRIPVVDTCSYPSPLGVHLRLAKLLLVALTFLAAGFVFAPVASAATGDFVITGRGFGHGAGMSQWGAWAAAREGVKYNEILAFYYQGTVLADIPLDQLVTVRLTQSSGSSYCYYRVDLKPTVTDATLVVHSSTGDTSASLAAGTVVQTTYSGGKVQVSGMQGSFDWVEIRPESIDGRVARTSWASSGASATTREYWGTIRVEPYSSAGALRLSNTVLMERYLRGVAEIDPGWANSALPEQYAPECVKAQQVAARTYAAAHAGGTVYDNTNDQVYLGYTWEATHLGVKAAVDATAGKILTYGGKPVATYFSTHSGGYLTNSPWTDNTAPAYIVAKADPWSLKAPVHPWDSLPGPGYPWTVTMSPATMTSKLGLGVGTISQVEVVSRDTSDPESHARYLRVTGSTGSATISARSFKSKLGLKSTLILSIVREGAPSAGVRHQQTDTRLAYTGTWSTFYTSKASAGGYARVSTNGASVTITFDGTYLAWIATKGTTLGKALVSLDGGAAVSVNLAASVVAYQQKVWDTGTLGSGTHTVKIWRDPTSASGKYISVDGFDVIGSLLQATSAATVQRHEQTDTRLAYTGTWSTFYTSKASAGGYARVSTNGASVTITFDGTYLAWIATKGTTLGKALVSLDGGAAVSVNLAASVVAYQQKVWDTGTLGSGTHTVKIWRDPTSASGKYISVDAVEVQGT